MKVQENIPLSKYTTFRIGGPAKYLLTVETTEDIIKAVEFAAEKQLPYFILGGGSNVLASDRGYDGVVILMENQERTVGDKTIMAEAGVKLSDLAEMSIDCGFTDLEWAAGIPGTVGGAVRGNAGAFGKSISESIKKVKALSGVILSPPAGGRRIPQKTAMPLRNASSVSFSGLTRESSLSLRGANPPEAGSQRSNLNRDYSLSGVEGSDNLTIKTYTPKDCHFNYRESVFKYNQEIILAADFKFKKGGKEKSRKLIKDYLAQRRQNCPLEYLSAGCIFKNPKPKSAGDLIEQAGLKGKQIGEAMISKKHANFIINLGNAKAEDVLALINLAQTEVKNKFKIQLKPEIQIIP